MLSDDTAILTDASPAGFAAGMLRAIDDPVWSATIAASASRLADTKYSYEAYLEKTRRAVAELSIDGALFAAVKDLA